MADLPFNHQLTKQEIAQRKGTKEGAESTKSPGHTLWSHEGSLGDNYITIFNILSPKGKKR